MPDGPADPDLAAHTLPHRPRGWPDLIGGLALIALVVAAGYFGYQWLMGDLPAERTRWVPMGFIGGCLLGPIASSLLGRSAGSFQNAGFGCFAGALAGVVLAGLLTLL